MKTSTTLSVLFCFISLVSLSQHNHDETEHFFASRSLSVFESDLQLGEAQLMNQNILNYVDSSYQSFHTLIDQRILAHEEISGEQFEWEYLQLLDQVAEGLVFIKPPSGSNSTPKALNGPCENMDFELGDVSGWTITRGDVDGLSPYSFVNEFGVGPGPYHNIFGGGVDPVCGIPRVNPLGGNFSVRLGNGTGVGARAARMKQTFLVDATNYMFTYSYAVVFQSPAGHTLNQLPYFTVRVIDSLGNSVPCGEYSVIADAANAPNYQSTNSGGSVVLYKDWETVFANLSAYIGQNVTVEFTSGDCSLTGHYGYAYVDASCGVDQITASNNIICQGDSSTLTAPAGAASYLWSNGATTQSTVVYNGGTYSCTLTPFQGGGCSITLDVSISENPSPLANYVASDVVGCFGDSISFTDQSSINAPGVISGLRWDFGDGVISPISNGNIVGVNQTTGTYLNPTHLYLTSGNFVSQLYVETPDGCTDSMNVNVTINDLPAVVAGPDQQLCEGSSVLLAGSGAQTYIWNQGVIDNVPFGQAVGTNVYIVTGTDVNGCVNQDSVEVVVFALPVVEAGIDQQLCDGIQITLTGSGAANYVWDNGVNDTQPFNQLIGTITYTVIGTDLNGCSSSDQVDVTVWPLPNVDAGLDQINCLNDWVQLNATGAASYQWDNSVVNNQPFQQQVGTVIYTVIGTDGNGCLAIDQVSVTTNDNPLVSAGPDVEICDGESVVLNGSGAVGYNWTGGILNNVAFVPNVGSYQYVVTGTDMNSCSNEDTVLVVVNPNPVIQTNGNQSTCEDSWVTLTAIGSPNLVWSGGIINSVSFQQPVGLMTYYVFDTLQTGCSAIDSVLIEVMANPIIVASDITVCEGQEAVLTASGALSYNWSNGIWNGTPFYPMESGTYFVIGTDVNGCTSQSSAFVSVNPSPKADFNWVNTDLSTLDNGSDFENLSIGGQTFDWDFSDGGYSNMYEPYHEFPIEEGGVYAVTLTVTSPEGCIDQITKMIEVDQEYTVYVPNTFTPDGNGMNEVFRPILHGFEEDDYTLYIFNRWGELIFESHDMSYGWNGTYAGRLNQVQDGVFSWKILARVKNTSETKEFVGHVSLLK